MQVSTICDCVDNTGVTKVKIIKVYGNSNNREAKICDRVLVTVVSRNLNVKNMKDLKRRNKFKIGTMFRAIVVQTKRRFFRYNRTSIKFIRNAVILSNKKSYPISKKIKGTITYELAYLYPKVASVSSRIV